MTQSNPTTVWTAKPSHAVNRELRVQLRRFSKSHRDAVERLAGTNARIADLAVAFPIALGLIATGEMGPAATAAAVEHTRAGAPLKLVARALGVPFWLRKLPPEAYRHGLKPLPDTPLFVRQIANHIPKSPQHCAEWLAWIAEAYAAADEHVAIWIAREFNKQRFRSPACNVSAIGLYAWFSSKPALEATNWMRKRWHPSMNLIDACDEARIWCDRMDFAFFPAMPWTRATYDAPDIAGVSFRRLVTPDELIEASGALDNCLDEYTWLMHGLAQVWSVTRDGQIIAAFEIEQQVGKPGAPHLRQALSRGNKLADPQLLAAIYRCLIEWPAEAVPTIQPAKSRKPDLAVYQRLMKPYWLAKHRYDMVPRQPEDDVFDTLTSGLGKLAYPRRRRRLR